MHLHLRFAHGHVIDGNNLPQVLRIRPHTHWSHHRLGSAAGPQTASAYPGSKVAASEASLFGLLTARLASVRLLRCRKLRRVIRTPSLPADSIDPGAALVCATPESIRICSPTNRRPANCRPLLQWIGPKCTFRWLRGFLKSNIVFSDPARASNDPCRSAGRPTSCPR